MQIITHHFETIDSTNTWAKKHVQEFQPDALTVITASTQTAGRGRFKRVWVSPKGVNIYATFCLFVDIQRSDIGHLPQLLALVTAELLENLGFSPALKWPNDVLIKNKKIAGILCETVTEGEKRAVICGIGLNVNMPEEICRKIDRPATSLLIEGQGNYKVDDLLEALIQRFHVSLSCFLDHGFSSFFEDFKKRSYLKLGDLVTFQDFQGPVEATFQTLNSDGSVTLKLQDGTIKNFHAGEILI